MRLIELPAYGGTAARFVLRPLSGADELSLAGTDVAAMLDLLARLATRSEGGALALSELSIAQTDRLLAALYQRLYGDNAECRVRCSGCAQGYEFNLNLAQIQHAQDADQPAHAEPGGGWRLADGRRVRAPRYADLEAADSSQALLRRLLLSGDVEPAPERISEFLERAAPVLSLDLAAPCPHCGRAETVRFDLARYLAQRLVAERPFLLREAHLIASRYGWSHAEIMALLRDDRRAYARLIESERAGALRRRAG
jgi:hypothetical protein